MIYDEQKPVAWISEAEADALCSGSHVRCLLSPYQIVGASVPVYLHPAPESWRPIETAPKDGSIFQTWRRHDTRPRHARFNTHYECIEDVQTGDKMHDLTHWMPAPKPPEELK